MFFEKTQEHFGRFDTGFKIFQHSWVPKGREVRSHGPGVGSAEVALEEETPVVCDEALPDVFSLVLEIRSSIFPVEDAGFREGRNKSETCSTGESAGDSPDRII